MKESSSHRRIGLNAHLLSAEAGYRRAGIHGYIYQLLAHLPVTGYTFDVFVGCGEPPPHPNFTVRRSRFSTENPLKRILWEQFAQPFQLAGLDLVHELAFVAPFVMPRPFVLTVYDLTFLRYPERLSRSRRVYLQTMTGLSCKRARRVIAISESTADDLVTLLNVPRSKIDVAIPGVETRFRPLPPSEVETWRQQMGLPDRFFLFVGTHEPRKNLPMLLRAYAALPLADRQCVPLILAGGKGWMTDEIDQVIEAYDLKATVIRPGFLADDALIFWYNAADALVYPSVFEGWGLQITEAMACGKPVLVSNVSSMPEAAGDTGYQLPPDDVPAWTAALAHCIADKTWRDEQGARARARAAGFTWEHTAQQTVKAYEKALLQSDETN